MPERYTSVVMRIIKPQSDADAGDERVINTWVATSALSTPVASTAAMPGSS